MGSGTASAVEVLLVEDDPDDARFVERCIHEDRVASGSGDGPRLIEVVRIETVGCLADGLERVRADSPDAVLLDLTLPDSSGLETVDRMVEAAPRIPVVVLTGRDDVGLGVRAIQRGAQDYLRKSETGASVLRRSLRYAIEREDNQRELLDRTHRLALLNRIVRTDLRNDVSMIVGRADELRDAVTPEGEAPLEALLEAANHTIDLVDTTGKLVDVLSSDGLDPTPCNLSSVVDAAVDSVQAEREATVTVDRDPATDAVTVYGSTMLESAFRHLLGTAVDFSDAEVPEVSVDVTCSDDRASVAVSQDGAWLPESRTAFLAQRGAAPDDSRIGVGLYLVRTVIDAVDGDLTVDEDPRRGTTVTVSLRRVVRG
jgi:signal transduction histidine kinase